jgi:hypothetical protein
MKNFNLLEEKNRLLSLNEQQRDAIQSIAEGLCLSQCINSKGKELIMYFGYLSDGSNLSAISTWVYEQVLRSESCTQREMIQQISDAFEEVVQNI